MSLHEELQAGSQSACILCKFLAGESDKDLAEWWTELRLPVREVANMAVVRALKRRGVEITEASVRRHRENHA